MYTVSSKIRDFLVRSNIIFAGTWGISCISIIMSYLYMFSSNSYDLYRLSHTVENIEFYAIIPSSVIFFLTCLAVSLFTDYGFLCNKFILARWIVFLILVYIGRFILSPIIIENVYPINSIKLYSLENNTLIDNINKIIFWGTIQSLVLVIIIGLSIIIYLENKNNIKTIKLEKY